MKTKLLTVTVLLTIALILTPLLPALAANALLNPGFENGSGGDADNWSESVNVARTATGAHTGDWGMEAELVDSDAVVYQDFTMAGTIYYSAWLYTDNADAPSIFAIMDLVTEENIVSESTSGTGWEYVSGSVSVVNNDLQAYAGNFIASGSVTFRIDDVCVSNTELDCAEETPTNTPTATSTETLTPTPTYTPTPTGTFTLTYTPTFTETLTPTSTATETATPTTTNTPTATNTLMPGPAQTATYEAAVADYIAIGRSQMPVSITVLGLCLVVVLVVIVGGIIWIVSKNRR